MPPLLSKMFAGDEAASSGQQQQVDANLDLSVDASIDAGIEYEDLEGGSHSHELDLDVGLDVSTDALIAGSSADGSESDT